MLISQICNFLNLYINNDKIDVYRSVIDIHNRFLLINEPETVVNDLIHDTDTYMYSFTLKFWFLCFSLFGVFSLTSLCLLQYKFFPASFLTRKLSSHSFIRPAVLSLTSGYVIYIVPQLCLRMNHVILQRKRYYLVKQLVSETYKWQKCCRKSLRLIRELELVSRGFTLYV